MSRKKYGAGGASSTFAILSLLFATLVTMPLSAQDDSSKPVEKTVLIKNVHIFDGRSENLITGTDVIVVGNRIDKLVPVGGDTTSFDQVIDGKGGYLTPGLIDAHVHAWMGSSVCWLSTVIIRRLPSKKGDGSINC